MLIEKQGDMFTTDAYVIGHGVNTQGAMGAGVAAVVREKFPTVYGYYREQYERGELRVGSAHGYLTAWPGTNRGVWVFNLATQGLPGPRARTSWIAESLRWTLQRSYEMGASKVALPRLGCGIGGLDWETQVKPIFEVMAMAYPDQTIEVWSL